MCMLTYFRPGIMPDMEGLENGAIANNDGHGYAIVSGDRVIVKRGMDFDAILTRFERDRSLHPGGAALFHSRWGTSGQRSKLNAHPFYVGGDRRTVMAHNGVFNVDVPKAELRCDTRLVADEFLPTEPFGPLVNRKARGRFARWMGTYNKVVLLTVDPAYRSNSYIFNEGSGYWDGNGIWYSNFDFLDPDWTPKGTTVGEAEQAFITAKDEERERCGGCQCEFTVDPVTRLCSVCGICADCADELGYCQCYQPSRWTNGNQGYALTGV